MEYHELGIFFDLRETPRRGHAGEAWEVFMKHCDPEMLKGSHLFQGEISGHLPGLGHMYCIAVRTPDLQAVNDLKKVFAECDDTRLAPPLDRVRESGVVQRSHLKFKGEVDSKGRLETRRWSRIDHDLCKVMGWPYAPHSYPKYLEPEKIDELQPKMRSIRSSFSGRFCREIGN